MEIKYYLDKAINEYLREMRTITAKKIMNYIYSEYNLDINMEEINRELKQRTSILEIVDGIFVDKNSFFSSIKEVDRDLLKLHIEFEYLVSIDENQMKKIFNIIGAYRKQKFYEYKKLNSYKGNKFENSKKTIYQDVCKIETNVIDKNEQTEEERSKIKWTYSKIIDFGMEHGYINSIWIQSIDYNLEKEVQDYFEAIEEIEEKGIKIMY